MILIPGRTYDQGAIYEFEPKAAPEREEMRRFLRCALLRNSPLMRSRKTLFRMMEGEK